MSTTSATFQGFAEVLRLPLRTPFRISRGHKTTADVVRFYLRGEGREVGAECVPYGRYGETPEGVCASLTELSPGSIESFRQRAALLRGAARNAVETALLALVDPDGAAESWEGFSPEIGAGTLVIDEPVAMADAARSSRFSILKMKLQGDDADRARLEAVHAAAPEKGLWVDANEGFSPGAFEDFMRGQTIPLALIEQPVPRGVAVPRVDVPLSADESFLTGADLSSVKEAGYRVVNIKLDKSGGPWSALADAKAAHEAGLSLGLGCMVASELGIAPAIWLYKRLHAEGVPVAWLDLDGATFLREPTALGPFGWGRP